MAPFTSKIPVAVNKDGPAKPPRDSKIAESTRLAKSSSSVHVQHDGAEKEDAALHAPSPEPVQQTEPERTEPEKTEPPPIEKLSEEHVHTLFSGAPNFFVQKTDKRALPRVSYPWDAELHIKDVSDSVQLAEPAYSAATLHKHLPAFQQSSDQDKPYQGYDVDVAEAPSMLSAQGIEPVSTCPSGNALRAQANRVLALREPLDSHTSSSCHSLITSSPISNNHRPATSILRA
jgi:hypothetical protein